MTEQSEDGYSGTDVLETLTDAHNYNTYLCQLISKYTAKSDHVVDFGAGVGLFAKEIAPHVAELTCIEADSYLLGRLAQQGLTAMPSLADMGDRPVDMLYTLNVLEHIEDDLAVLRQIHGQLKPGAVLFVYVPAFQLLYTSFDKKVGHHRRYSRSDLARRVTAAGFEIERLAYVDSLGFFAALAYKLLDKGSGELNLRYVKVYDRFIFPMSKVLDHVFKNLFGKNLLVVARKRVNDGR